MEAKFNPIPRAILESGKESKWEVHISYNHPKFPGCYGYFEHDEQGEGGGLWFERRGDKWALRDYDGVSCISPSVLKSLAGAGFIVDEEFY